MEHKKEEETIFHITCKKQQKLLKVEHPPLEGDQGVGSVCLRALLKVSVQTLELLWHVGRVEGVKVGIPIQLILC